MDGWMDCGRLHVHFHFSHFLFAALTQSPYHTYRFTSRLWSCLPREQCIILPGLHSTSPLLPSLQKTPQPLPFLKRLRYPGYTDTASSDWLPAVRGWTCRKREERERGGGGGEIWVCWTAEAAVYHLRSEEGQRIEEESGRGIHTRTEQDKIMS